MIIAKLVFIIVSLIAASPFVWMFIAFVGGASVAPGTTKKDKIIITVAICTVLAFVYIGIPLFVIWI